MDKSRTVLILPIIMVCVTCMFINAWLPLTSHTWLFLLIGCLLGLVSYPNYLATAQFVFLFFYSSIIIFNYLNGDDYFNELPQVLNEVAMLFFTSLLSSYLLKFKDWKARKRTVNCFSFVIIMAVIGTILAEQITPGAIRMVVGLNNSNADPSLYIKYYRLGMSNFYLPHALPAVLPVLIAGLKTDWVDKRYKTSIAILLVSCLLIIWFSGAATALIASFFIVLVALFTKVDSFKNNKTAFIPIGVFLLVFINKDYLIIALQWIIDLMSGEGAADSFADHLFVVMQFFDTGEVGGDLGKRSDVYDQTLHAFLNNPMFGATTEKLGHHSALLDRLAALGIIGFTPYFLFLFFQISYTYKHIPKFYRLFYIESLIAVGFVLATKNMSCVEMWVCLFLIAPMLLLMFSYYLESKSFNNNKNVSI